MESEPENVEAFAPGVLIGRYRLLAPLASGGMAHVWAAKPEGAGFAKTIALKLIRGEYSADEEYARMFIDEATVASSVHHPNVCETYELGRHEDTLYMALEWIAGDSLTGLIHQGQSLKPLDPPIAARIVAEALAGLHAAHEAIGPDGIPLNIVHRDISPPNILISISGQVKVSDFGIAKARYQLHAKTRAGEIKGKFAYIAPEQIIGKNVDRRSDIYSMGCVLYMATVGLRPFGSGPRAMSKILKNEYRRPAEVVEGYPPALDAIVVKALQKEQDLRYQTAEEMRLDLEEYLVNCTDRISHAEVARLVRERMNPEKKAAVEALLISNKFLPDVLAYRMMESADDRTQTPTASSGIATAPRPLRGKTPAVGVEISRADGTPSKGRGQPKVRYGMLDVGSRPSSSSHPKIAAGSGSRIPSGAHPRAREPRSESGEGVRSSRRSSIEPTVVPDFRGGWRMRAAILCGISLALAAGAYFFM